MWVLHQGGSERGQVLLRGVEGQTLIVPLPDSCINRRMRTHFLADATFGNIETSFPDLELTDVTVSNDAPDTVTLRVIFEWEELDKTGSETGTGWKSKPEVVSSDEELLARFPKPTMLMLKKVLKALLTRLGARIEPEPDFNEASPEHMLKTTVTQQITVTEKITVHTADYVFMVIDPRPRVKYNDLTEIRLQLPDEGFGVITNFNLPRIKERGAYVTKYQRFDNILQLWIRVGKRCVEPELTLEVTGKNQGGEEKQFYTLDVSKARPPKAKVIYKTSPNKWLGVVALVAMAAGIFFSLGRQTAADYDHPFWMYETSWILNWLFFFFLVVLRKAWLIFLPSVAMLAMLILNALGADIMMNLGTESLTFWAIWAAIGTVWSLLALIKR